MLRALLHGSYMSKDPAGIALSASESYQVLLLGFHRVFRLCLLRCLGEVPQIFYPLSIQRWIFIQKDCVKMEK